MPIVLPSRVDGRKLGTMSADYELLNKHGDAEKRLVIRKRWEDDGAKGRHRRMQPPRPNVGEV